MLKNLPLFIGLRYTRSKRSEGFVSFISAFSLGAMALGVLALIVVLSVMNGFDREIKGRLLLVAPHLTVSRQRGFTLEEITGFEERFQAQVAEAIRIKSVTPMVSSFVMLRNADRQTGVAMQGINPEHHAILDLLSEHMISGSLQSLAPGEFGVVLGSQIARKLGVFTGDKISLALPKVSVTPAGVFPRSKLVTVQGIFQVGAQVDAGVIFIHQADAQKLLQLGDRFPEMRIQFADAYRADEFVAQQSIADGERWETWTQQMATLFQAMHMEKIVVGLLLSVIIAVAAFNIVASLVLMVADKRKDIAVVRALGATSQTIMRIFIVQGVAVGALGIAAGAVLGCLVAYFVGDIVGLIERMSGQYLFDPSIYLIQTLPSKILPGDVALVVSGAFVLSLLATLLPAWRAGQVMPAEALRYDH